MILDQRVNAARSRNSCGAGGGDGVPFGIFSQLSCYYQGLEQAGGLVNPPEKRFR
jgi:hypothetical protein